MTCWLPEYAAAHPDQCPTTTSSSSSSSSTSSSTTSTTVAKTTTSICEQHDAHQTPCGDHPRTGPTFTLPTVVEKCVPTAQDQYCNGTTVPVEACSDYDTPEHCVQYLSTTTTVASDTSIAQEVSTSAIAGTLPVTGGGSSLPPVAGAGLGLILFGAIIIKWTVRNANAIRNH